MTTREFLNAVIAANVSDDITTYATDAVNALDARNEKRKETRANSAKVKENEALKLDALKRIPSDGIMSSVLAEQMGLTTAKAAARRVRTRKTVFMQCFLSLCCNRSMVRFLPPMRAVSAEAYYKGSKRE